MQEFINIKRFRQIIVGAHFHGLDCRIHCGIARHHNDLHRWIEIFDLLEEFNSIHSWHTDVQKHDIKPGSLSLDHFQGSDTVGHPQHLITLPGQKTDAALADRLFIVHHKNSYLFLHPDPSIFLLLAAGKSI